MVHFCRGSWTAIRRKLIAPDLGLYAHQMETFADLLAAQDKCQKETWQLAWDMQKDNWYPRSKAFMAWLTRNPDRNAEVAICELAHTVAEGLMYVTKPYTKAGAEIDAAAYVGGLAATDTSWEQQVHLGQNMDEAAQIAFDGGAPTYLLDAVGIQKREASYWREWSRHLVEEFDGTIKGIELAPLRALDASLAKLEAAAAQTLDSLNIPAPRTEQAQTRPDLSSLEQVPAVEVAAPATEQLIER